MIEKEVKILEINKEKVEEKLTQLGAVKNFESEIETYYYDFEDKRLEKEDSVLRLRLIKGKELFIDLKKRISKERLKESREIKISLKDTEEIKEAKELIESLGLKIKLHMKKKRTSYKIRNALVEIDEIEGIPTFLEIEGEEKRIEELTRELGLKENKRVTFDTFELLDYYSKT